MTAVSPLSNSLDSPPPPLSAAALTREAAGLALPAVFGRYVLLRRLSRGGMGEIFLATLGEIQGFEKLVIIKKILPHLVANEEFIKRFIDEAQVAIKLNHANIAAVFEVGRTAEEYFLAIEYVEGRDLRRLITRLRELGRRLPVDLCLFICRELASGLAYAHRRTDDKGRPLALVHCDISPPNVMVSHEGEIKIIDFGIAKSAIRLAGSNPNMGFGKFGYMAPEQLVRGGVIDRRSDIYAAGVVLFELLTGERLLQFPDGTDYREIARAVTQGKIDRPSQRDPLLDKEIDEVVMRALATRPADRYQSAEEMRDAIAAKLAQLNPTMNADVLASYMRDVFQDEIREDDALLESLKVADLSVLQERMTQPQQTVTFARATGLPSGSHRVVGGGESAPENDFAVEPDDEFSGPSEEELLATHRKRRRWFFLGALLASLAGGTMTFALVRSLGRPQVVVTLPPTPVVLQPSDQVKTQPLPQAQPLQPEPTVVAVQVPPPAAAPAEVPTPQAAVPVATEVATKIAPVADKRHRHHSSHDRAAKTHGLAASPSPANLAAPSSTKSHSAESVQAKFRATKRAYVNFKGQYGGVLEDRWNAIVSEITFGQSTRSDKSDKYERVNVMLDELVRDMAKPRP